MVSGEGDSNRADASFGAKTSFPARDLILAEPKRRFRAI
jgi:hypothetical protein